MNIDWNGDLEYKVWGATLEKMNHGWEKVGKVVANGDGTYQVHNANKEIYCGYVFSNGKILKLSSCEHIGQVRNKKVESIDWTKELECKVWGGDATILRHPPHDWMSVKEYVNKSRTAKEKLITLKNGYTWHVLQDGSIHSQRGKVGQVRNKRTDTKATMPSNLATFYFDKQGDTYTSTGWKNVMSPKEIEHKYGRDVWREYWSAEQPGFILSAIGLSVIVGIDGDADLIFMKKSRQFTKEEYENLIKVLKQAGERLSKLIKDSKKVEKIEVVI